MSDLKVNVLKTVNKATKKMVESGAMLLHLFPDIL